MAKLVLKEAFFSADGNDFSANLKQVTIKVDKDIKDATGMNAEWEEVLASTRKAEISVQLFQDYDGANSVDQVHWDKFNSDDTIALVLRSTQAAKGTSNPEWTANAYIPSYQPLGGSKGDVVMAPISYRVTGGLTRSTS